MLRAASSVVSRVRTRHPVTAPPAICAFQRLNQSPPCFRAAPFSTSLSWRDASTSSPPSPVDVMITNVHPSTSAETLNQFLKALPYASTFTRLRRRENKQYAHVTFPSALDAALAVQGFTADPPILSESTLGAKVSHDPAGMKPKRGKVLYIGNVPIPEGQTVLDTERHLKSLFEAFGRVLQVLVVARTGEDRKEKGTAWANVEVCKLSTADAIIAAAESEGGLDAVGGYAVTYSNQRREKHGFAPLGSPKTERVRCTQVNMNEPFLGMDTICDAVLAKTGVEPYQCWRQKNYQGRRVTLAFRSVEDAERVIDMMEDEEVAGTLLRWDFAPVWPSDSLAEEHHEVVTEELPIP